MTIYETKKDDNHPFAKFTAQQKAANNKECNFSISVDAKKTYQTFKGFGGAATEATGYVLSQLSKEKQDLVMKSYFDSAEGNNYGFIRTHMNSCDFALGNWACVENKDETLNSFSMEQTNKYIVPALKKAKEILDKNAKTLNLLITPWSPPAWMKDNNDMNHGGKLLPEFWKLWAEYFCRFIEELKKQQIDVSYVTVQNEPAAKQVWDSCLWSAQEEADFAVNYLYPAFVEHKLQDIKILIWDHNRDLLKERFDDSMAVLGADKAIAGAGFHWYSGGHFENLKYVTEKYPSKEFIFTEGCIEGGPQNGKWHTGERYAHNIINDLNNGCHAWIDWNLLLNMEGGPNHVGNMCDAPILANPETDEVFFQSSFYYIGHFSKFIKPGAVRIDSEICFAKDKESFNEQVEATAFKNPDDSIAVVLLNKTEEELAFEIKLENGESNCLVCPPRSIQTFIYN